jgi:ribosomal protein L10
VYTKGFFYFTTVRERMAISKSKKKELIEQYVSDLSNASNAVIIQQSGV